MLILLYGEMESNELSGLKLSNKSTTQSINLPYKVLCYVAEFSVI